MKTKTIKKLITVAMITLLISACSKTTEVEYIEPITIDCGNVISLDSGTKLNLLDHCKITPETTLISFQNEPEIDVVGKHTARIILSDGKHNNLVIKDIDYEILKPIPECPENATYDEESEKCICNEGYVNMGTEEECACELKAVCQYGYSYNAKTNTCYKKQTYQPSQTQTVNNTPTHQESSGGGSDDSGSGSGNTQPSNPTPAPTPSPSPAPSPAPAPDPTPSTAGSQTCSPSGNSQEALDAAYSACVAACSSHGNCSVYWDGSNYVASWE